LSALLVFISATILFLGYRTELGEDDLYRMLVGILYHHASDSRTLYYGYSFSFGYYWLVERIGEVVPLTRANGALIMNLIGAAAAVAGVAALFAHLAGRYGRETAALATVLFALTPIYLDLSMSGHPIVPAFAAFMAAACVLDLTRGVWPDALRIGLGVALLVAALAFRAEIVLAFPWLAIDPKSTTPRAFVTEAVRRGLPLAAAFVVFLVLQGLAVRSSGQPAGGGALKEFFGFWFGLQYGAKNVLGFGLGMGLGLGLLALWAVAAFLRTALHERSFLAWAPLLDAAALVAPTLILWIFINGPARHFLLGFLGAAVLSARYLRSTRRPWLAALVAVLATQASGAVAEPLMARRKRVIYENSSSAPWLIQPFGMFATHQLALSRWRSEMTRAYETDLNHCAGRILFVTDASTHLASVLLPRLSGDVRVVKGLEDSFVIASPSLRAVVIDRWRFWPGDPVPTLMRRYDRLRVYDDPNTRTRYDRTRPPAARAVPSCGAP
jgi:hypothetical protein